MRANTLARPEHHFVTPLNSPVATAVAGLFIAPDAEYQAGRAAAIEWFSLAMKSMGEHRDDVRCTLVRNIENEADAAAASYLFNQGFAAGIAQVIAGGSHD